MNDSVKKLTPAYTTYKSFFNLINDFREDGIPPHITRSVVKGSNSAKSMMSASLKSLNLIDDDMEPTEKLKMLVESGDDYSTALNLVLQEAYPSLFDGSINLSNTTTEKVVEKFREAGAQGSTVTKCMSFFIAAAKAAEIDIHPRVKAPAIDRSKQVRRKKPKVQQQEESVSTSVVDDADSGMLEGMEKITVPLRNMDDGIIFFPPDLEVGEAKKAVKMAVFILNEFYGIESE